MDGSSAGYYYSPGTDSSSYIIYMEGGYWCWDAPSCQQRCTATSFACSSKGWQPVIAQEGLFSSLPAGASNPFASVSAPAALHACSERTLTPCVRRLTRCT